MTIAIVEPHPDDAFLSLGWHIEHMWRGRDLLIVTVYADKRRGEEAKAYAKAVGAESIVIGLEESKMDSGCDDLSPPGDVTRYLRECSKVLLPLGLQHPDHLRVSNLSVLLPDSKLYYYLDTPYQLKRKMESNVERSCRKKSIYSIAFPSKTKWRRASIFKSQSKFFYYNKDMIERNPPEVVLKLG